MAEDGTLDGGETQAERLNFIQQIVQGGWVQERKFIVAQFNDIFVVEQHRFFCNAPAFDSCAVGRSAIFNKKRPF